MSEQRLRQLLDNVRAGNISVDDAVAELRALPFEDLGFAKVDHHRALRQRFGEVIFCSGKTTQQIVEIVRSMLGRTVPIMATHASPEVFEAIRPLCPDAHYHEAARIVTIGAQTLPDGAQEDEVLVISAGTADIPVAEEAAVTAQTMGCRVGRLYDVGVAGIHRLLEHRDRLLAAQTIIVVAGMDGALASVVGGLVRCPLIAVPTSVGYGASFGGLAALLTMLNSCAAGIAVVNIDNGFGAGLFAANVIAQTREGQSGQARESHS